MPAHYNITSPTEILHKRALEQGWVYRSLGRGGSSYYNPKTGQTTKTPPLPSGWSVRTVPGGVRYVGVGGQFSVTMPTSPAVAKAAPAAAAADDKSTGSAKPRPVVSAKGLLNGDTDRPLVASGGQPILTTPFGIVGGAPVKKKKLLGV
jgi:hypothetical protein